MAVKISMYKNFHTLHGTASQIHNSFPVNVVVLCVISNFYTSPHWPIYWTVFMCLGYFNVLVVNDIYCLFFILRRCY